MYLFDSSFLKGQCKCEHLCKACFKVPDLVIHPGDFYIVLVLSVNEAIENKICLESTGTGAGTGRFYYWQACLASKSLNFDFFKIYLLKSPP